MHVPGPVTYIVHVLARTAVLCLCVMLPAALRVLWRCLHACVRAAALFGATGIGQAVHSIYLDTEQRNQLNMTVDFGQELVQNLNGLMVGNTHKTHDQTTPRMSLTQVL